MTAHCFQDSTSVWAIEIIYFSPEQSGPSFGLKVMLNCFSSVITAAEMVNSNHTYCQCAGDFHCFMSLGAVGFIILFNLGDSLCKTQRRSCTVFEYLWSCSRIKSTIILFMLFASVLFPSVSMLFPSQLFLLKRRKLQKRHRIRCM